MGRRVVVTGMGVISPVGIGMADTFDALVERRCGIRRIEAFDPSGFESQVGGEAPKYSMGDYVPKGYRKAVKVMARDIELAVIAAYLAAKDAGLHTKCLIDRGEAPAPPNIDLTRMGANIGAGTICADLVELAGALASAVEDPAIAAMQRKFSYARWGGEGMNNLTPLWLLKFLPNMLACHVTIVHDCQAPSNTITCGEASSHLAIGEAFRTISRGAADLCICGGAESKINPMGLMRPTLLKRLTSRGNDNPATACRPFDRDRSGGVVSEGGGLLILEELAHAKARNAKIYAELVGFGSSCNTSSWNAPQPDGRAIRIAMEKAIRDAGLSPSNVELVNPFGLGTREHDASEAAAIHAVFGDRAAKIPVLATKGALGNNGAGSGAIDIAITIAAMHRGVLPPSQNTENVDCGLNVVRGDPSDARANVAVTSSMALSGGQTAALVIKRFAD